MTCMFAECPALTELDLRSFDTSNATDMEGMFFACQSLTKIYSKDERIGKLKKKFKQTRGELILPPKALQTYFREIYERDF